MRTKKGSSILFDAEENLYKDKSISDILINMSKRYSNLQEFLSDIALNSINEQQDETDNLVISTIHSAKGLEWPVVILIDCYDKCEYTNIDLLEEELRTLYVALTRAEDNLILAIPETMNSYNESIDIAIKSCNYEMYHKQQAAFHQVYINKCGNDTLIAAIEQLKNKILKKSYTEHPYNDIKDIHYATNKEHKK